MTPSDVIHHAGAGQFELRSDAGTALLRYALQGDRIALVHTEVPEQARGQGVGEVLVRAALDYARREKLAVVPTCPFVKAFLAKHAEYADLVAR